jgi:hypothetical protein
LQPLLLLVIADCNNEANLPAAGEFTSNINRLNISEIPKIVLSGGWPILSFLKYLISEVKYLYLYDALKTR